MRYLSKQHLTHMVRVPVPKPLWSVVGRRELIRSLKTDSFNEAKRLAPAIIAEFQAIIARARADEGEPPDLRLKVQQALAAWSLTIIAAPAAREPQTPWEAIEAAAALERAVADPEGWRRVPDFDARAAEALARGGLRMMPSQLGPYRQEIALAFLYAEKHREKERAMNAALIAYRTAEKAGLAEMLPTEAAPLRPAPRPSLTLQTLFERWTAAEPPPAEKERGRLEHQMRRLTEFVGDIPASHLSKRQIEEFFGFVSKVPTRRSAAQHAMPIRALVDWVDATNEREEEQAEIERREARPIRTLTKATASEWFQGFSRMFKYGVRLELLERNPFEGMNATVRGSASVKRRAYTPDEIAIIFAKPMFRDETGAKRWLPVLALFHGARLSELAAMPRSHFRQIGEHWCFDLTADDRKLKTEAARRIIPLHPKLVELGWLTHFKGLDGEWLFPDLDHASAHGPGHEFSKWWGIWMDEQGLTDPALTFHSFRHAWKRRARASDVKEEMHNIISGHRGFGAGQDYGRGADIAPLVRDMALITFPEFPLPTTRHHKAHV